MNYSGQHYHHLPPTTYASPPSPFSARTRTTTYYYHPHYLYKTKTRRRCLRFWFLFGHSCLFLPGLSSSPHHAAATRLLDGLWCLACLQHTICWRMHGIAVPAFPSPPCYLLFCLPIFNCTPFKSSSFLPMPYPHAVVWFCSWMV